ncbi:uncharacterized protein DUF4249 [Mucilaginibacter gracilis]|uniref:Uncharacterized protein DUF4249 n=1 Tax=Mucilaginibacter gracilis TaxID=423350 RepID=A0A495J1S3_9SPHI|nr:DUF4249 domain-containing protein [Mucilaginibacter gracilis]RKR82877.1 uncharacterized protein DUF4249 [Mucilaginibacter gracilis]
MKNSKLYTILSLSLILSACTKVIDLKLGNDSGKLVIEANVTNANAPQIIKLSKNVAFTTTNTYPPVSGATVTVTDQTGQIYRFTEGVSGTYTNSQLKGIAGYTYTMSVLTGSITYAASSKMPASVAIDSVTSKNNAFSSGSNPTKEISVHYHDPAGVPNYYLCVMSINGVQVKNVFAFDDEFNDGLAVSEVLRETDIDIHAGDKITVEMQCLDKPIYTYWFTLSQQSANGPGGSVTPSNPPTNISPVSLGYFSAHTTQSITIIAK